MTMESDSTGPKPGEGNGAVVSSASPPAAGGEAAAGDPPGDKAAPAGGPAAPSELQSAQAERDKLREQLLRTAADFDNFRKRTKRDLDDARQRAKDELIRDLLPIFDNLERALQTAGGASDMSSVIEGVRMVLKLFEDTAERVGLTRVPAVGERFDPAVHEAIQQRETDEQPPGTVIAEVVAGYRFGERLVRPAMVVVARKPAAAARASQPPDGGGDGQDGGAAGPPREKAE